MPETQKLKLNDGQAAAVEHITEVVKERPGSFVVLKGPAGTGKSTVSSSIISDNSSLSFVSTAPTNKATRVLREIYQKQEMTVPAMTIYKLLGIAVMSSGEIKYVNKVGGTVNLTCDVVLLDEMGFVGSRLSEYVFEAARVNPHVSWVLSGDEYQLPPVKEIRSPLWDLPDQSALTKVERTDNQILTISTHVREIIDSGGRLNIKEDYDERGGVFIPKDFTKSLKERAEDFRSGDSKAIAWRNATVLKMNKEIRSELVDNPALAPYQEGERITVTEQALDFNGELVAYTDDEFTVLNYDVLQHPIFRRFTCWRIGALGNDGVEVALWALHERSEGMYQTEVKRLADLAYADRSLWKDFWGFKESFHQVRHAYAQTAHRAQGSTYINAYVDWRDILVNRNMAEAMRCLYVGFSRPRINLHLS